MIWIAILTYTLIALVTANIFQDAIIKTKKDDPTYEFLFDENKISMSFIMTFLCLFWPLLLILILLEKPEE